MFSGSTNLFQKRITGTEEPPYGVVSSVAKLGTGQIAIASIADIMLFKQGMLDIKQGSF